MYQRMGLFVYPANEIGELFRNRTSSLDLKPDATDISFRWTHKNIIRLFYDERKLPLNEVEISCGLINSHSRTSLTATVFRNGFNTLRAGDESTGIVASDPFCSVLVY